MTVGLWLWGYELWLWDRDYSAPLPSCNSLSITQLPWGDWPAHRHSSVSLRSKNVTRDKVATSLREATACMDDSTLTISHNMVMPSTGGDICRRSFQKVTRSTHYVSTPSLRPLSDKPAQTTRCSFVYVTGYDRSVKRRGNGCRWRNGIDRASPKQQRLENVNKCCMILHELLSNFSNSSRRKRTSTFLLSNLGDVTGLCFRVFGNGRIVN